MNTRPTAALRILLVLVGGALADPLPAQTPAPLAAVGPSSSPASSKPAGTALQYKWIILENNNTLHKTTVGVNGTPLAEFQRQGFAFDAKPSPLKDGNNEIVITISPMDANRPRFVRPSRLRVLLSPAMMAGDDTVLLGECEAEWEVVEYKMVLAMSKEQPGRIEVLENRWHDLQRKHRSHEWRAEHHAFGEQIEKALSRSWDPNGGLEKDEEYARGRLLKGKYHRPDGAVGGEVKDGNGVRRLWTMAGGLTDEVPYEGGLTHGQMKEYDGTGVLRAVTTYVKGQRQGEYVQYGLEGKVVIRGQFRDDMKEGVWIRFDEDGKETDRSEFREGELTKGRYRFPVD